MDALRLMAVDADDLSILSAHCQDAVLRAGDIRHLATERRLIVPMNRFVWENAVETRRGLFSRRRAFERRRAVLRFDRVTGVRRQGGGFADPDAVLVLLALRFLPGEAPSGTLDLVFAGGSAIRLDAEVIEAQLTDLGAAWGTRSLPDHDGSGHAD